jgi:glycosyltransferase involved in cell wall biosynthesis
MSSEPIVSILVPAYNTQEWIGKTIRSALAQPWARKEIIVLDDGSKDETFAVAPKFEVANVNVATNPNAAATARGLVVHPLRMSNLSEQLARAFPSR